MSQYYKNQQKHIHIYLALSLRYKHKETINRTKYIGIFFAIKLT